MKKLTLAALFFLIFTGVSQGMGNSQNQQDNSQNNDASINQAKQDYRLYLDKLKELSAQYGQVTNQMKKVIKEEGVPTWDDKTGQIQITHDLNFSDNGPVRETEKEVKLILEVPGLKKDSIRVSVEDETVLRIQAVRKAVEDGGQEEPVEQTFNLPSRVQDKNTHAKYEDGILTVTLQKILTPKKTVAVPVQ